MPYSASAATSTTSRLLICPVPGRRISPLSGEKRRTFTSRDRRLSPMGAPTVHVTYAFAKPADRVFAYLAEHENLGPLFGAKVKRLRDGDSDRNGVNSARELKVGPLP